MAKPWISDLNRGARGGHAARRRPLILECACLGLILLGGAWLRLSNLKSQGLYFWDESHFLLHARTYASLARWAVRPVPDGPRRRHSLAGGLGQPLPDGPRFLGKDMSGLKEELRKEGGTIPYTAGRPGYAALVGVAYLICGGRDFSTLLLSAGFGLATVLLLHLCGRTLRGPPAGFLSAALLAGLGGHVWYSRLGLACAAVGFFTVLGFHRLLRSVEQGTDGLLPAGIFFGIAFTVHPLALPSLLAVFAALCLGRGEGPVIPSRALAFALGCLLPVLGWEVLFQLRNLLSPEPLPSYFREYLSQAQVNSAQLGRFRPNSALLYLDWLKLSSGIPATVLLAAGLICCLPPKPSGGGPPPSSVGERLTEPYGEEMPPPRSVGERLAWSLGPGTLLLWCLALALGAQPIARTLSACLPFLCLLSGLGWSRLVDAAPAKIRAWAGAAAAALLFLAPAAWSKSYRHMRSPYPDLAEFLRERPGKFLSTCDPLLQFYLPETRWRSVHWPGPQSPPGKPPDARTLILDFIVYYSFPAKPPWLAPLMERPPIRTFPYGLPDYRLIGLDSDPTRWTPRLPVWGDAFTRGVQVYDFGRKETP